MGSNNKTNSPGLGEDLTGGVRGLFGFGLFILPLVFSIVYFVMYSNDKKKQKNLLVAALDSNNTKESNTLNDELNALLASKNRGEITEEEYLAKKKDLIGY